MTKIKPHTVGSYVHVIKRGTRGLEIVRNENDRWRFLKLLFYLNNDNYRNEKWENELFKSKIPLFEWPNSWPKREKLVEVAAYTLMPNHFHLLLRELKENGVSVFMQGLCGSMTLYFNEKYNERGSLFQGIYKKRLVDTDEYLRHIAIYIMVKNSFELYPGGLDKAIRNFDRAWEKSLNYNFSSLADYGSNRKSSIVDKGLLNDLFPTPKKFKEFAKDTMLGRKINELGFFE